MNQALAKQLLEARKTWRAKFLAKYFHFAPFILLAVFAFHGVFSAILIGYGLKDVSPWLFWYGTAAIAFAGITAPAGLAMSELEPYPTASHLRKVKELYSMHERGKSSEV